MTIEIMHGQSIWQYRTSPTDARTIERRENRHGARFTWYARRDSAQEARRTLLSLQAGEEQACPEQNGGKPQP